MSETTSVASLSQPTMLYGLDDRPNFFTSLLVGFQHVLAVFGGILTAPLIMAMGMGLSVRDTSYLVSSALLISGVATLLQIQRFGIVGSGLLSIQGTSFSFIGPTIAAFYVLGGADNPGDALGTLFGSAAVCSMIMVALSFGLPRLGNIITPNVTGATVMLLGATLVWTTFTNIQRVYAGADPGDGWQVILLSSIVFFTIVIIARSGNAWLKLSSITVGLLIGYITAFALGMVDFSLLSELDNLFVPQLARYPLNVDWRAVAMLLPIFIISMMESVGDLTATSSLSGLATRGKSYWTRMKGGVLGDALNSLMASVFCTFPNTTFSQNNGVIQLTGVCSRYVGFFVAGLLVLLGFFPIVGGIFQVMPEPVLHGATLLMFSMVAYSGFRIVKTGSPQRNDWLVVAVSIIGGIVASLLVDQASFLPTGLITVIQFPVTTGALIALLIESARFVIRRSENEYAE